MFDLSGKSAFVTGAASGIGEAIAHALADAGAYVFVADLNTESGESVAAKINQDGGGAEFVLLNIAEQAECNSVATGIHASRGHIDILVNNAGIGHVGTILNTETEDLERLFRVNVLGTFGLTKAFIGPMIERRYGVIVNIASIGGVIGIRERIAYCTSKFAVVGFTKSLALDHAMDGIRANAVCPGRVETPFVRSRLAEYPDPEKAYREMSETQAIGRMGTPEEIAAAVLYLSSDEAAFITGTALEIDGGWSAGK